MECMSIRVRDKSPHVAVASLVNLTFLQFSLREVEIDREINVEGR
jgi:hypothetical protein